jgi:Ca2+-binding EF-hand superfamily protein
MIYTAYRWNYYNRCSQNKSVIAKKKKLTSKDVDVQWEQYQGFLSRKEKMLEEEIEHHKLRGVTQDQFNEIEKTFKQFDTDNSGNIDKKELKACLYSLGEEKSKSEIEQIMTKYGSKEVNGIKYENFREFMIDLLGVSDTKDDILNSFKLINKGDEVAKVDKMEILMNNEDIGYFTKTAPAEGSAYNYKSWAESVFSR